MLFFNDIITDKNIDFSDILLNEKLYKEKYRITLIYDTLWKTSMRTKPLCRFDRFDKIDEVIKIHNEIRYLVLFDYGWHEKTCDRITYLISEKSGYKQY